MTFFAYCPFCEAKVGNATTVLGGAALERALESDNFVEAVHLTLASSNQGDHVWRLNREEKARLKKILAEVAVLKNQPQDESEPIMKPSPGVRHSIQSITCQHCRTHMVVKHEFRAGAGAMCTEIVACIKCKKEFSILLPGPLLDGPFPE